MKDDVIDGAIDDCGPRASGRVRVVLQSSGGAIDKGAQTVDRASADDHGLGSLGRIKTMLCLKQKLIGTTTVVQHCSQDSNFASSRGSIFTTVSFLQAGRCCSNRYVGWGKQTPLTTGAARLGAAKKQVIVHFLPHNLPAHAEIRSQNTRKRPL